MISNDTLISIRRVGSCQYICISV